MQWVFLVGVQEQVMVQLDHIGALAEKHIKEWIQPEDRLLQEQESRPWLPETQAMAGMGLGLFQLELVQEWELAQYQKLHQLQICQLYQQ
jgi:hypothetical protein